MLAQGVEGNSSGAGETLFAGLTLILGLVRLTSLIMFIIGVVSPGTYSSEKRTWTRGTVAAVFLPVWFGSCVGMCVAVPDTKQDSSSSLAVEAEAPKPTEKPSRSRATKRRRSDPLSPMKGPVKLEINAAVGADKRVTVSGATNLPNQTDLMISIERDKPYSSFGQDNAKVRGGYFASQALGPPAGLVDGEYVASVTAPIASVQPESVQKVIDKEGEHLKGPLVKRDKLLGRTVSASKSFIVGADAKSARKAQAAEIDSQRRAAREIYDELRALEKEGRSMENLRDRSDDLASLKRCGDLMRERQPRTKTLRGRTGELPVQLALNLNAAASHMNLCVSCMKTALESCDFARMELADAETAIAGWK